MAIPKSTVADNVTLSAPVAEPLPPSVQLTPVKKTAQERALAKLSTTPTSKGDKGLSDKQLDELERKNKAAGSSPGVTGRRK